MLIRFTGIDVLDAAGPSAKVPSRLGVEQEAILNPTHPNGTALQDSTTTTDNDEPVLLSGDLLLDEEGETILSKEREEFYGARRTAVLVIVLLVAGLAIFWLFKHVSNRHRRSKMRLPDDNIKMQKRVRKSSERGYTPVEPEERNRDDV